MSSFKINIALVKECPPLITLKAALETVGRPSDKDYGVLGVHEIIGNRLEFAIFRTKTMKVKQVEKSDGSVSVGAILKDELFEAAIRLTGESLGVLEVYSGSAKSTDRIGEFLKVLELADEVPEVEYIPQDIMGNIGKLSDGSDTKLFRVESAKVKSYEDHTDEKLKGTFTVRFPKDLPPANALAFLNDYAAKLESVKVRYRQEGMLKPMSITLRASAYYTLGANDQDETKSKNVGRRLAGVLTDQGR